MRERKSLGREDDILKLVELGATLTPATNLENLLEQVIERIKRLVGVEMAGLSLYDQTTDELVLQKPALGRSDEVIKRSRMPVALGGASARVFLDGVPVLSNDPLHDPIFRWPTDRSLDARGMIIVPVSVGGERIGTFHVVNKLCDGFTRDDLRLVSVLMSFLGILVQNTRLIEDLRQAVLKLEEQKTVIERQREEICRTLAYHDDLTRLVLEGQGLQAITSSLGRLLYNPVVVEDRFGVRIGAYLPSVAAEGRGPDSDSSANWTSVREAISAPTNHALLSELTCSSRPLRFPPVQYMGTTNSLVVAPVIVGHEVLGYVSVIERYRRLDDWDLVAIERGAMVIALELMNEKAAAEALYKWRGDLTAELVDGVPRDPEIIMRRASHLGVDLRCPRIVLVVDIDGFTAFARRNEAEEKVLMLKATLLEVVERTCRRVAPDTVIAARRDEIMLLARVAAAAQPGDLIEPRMLADTIRVEVRKFVPDISVSIGIGCYCDALADYHRSYSQAIQALSAIRALRQSDRTLDYGELGIYGLLFSGRGRDELAAFVSKTLGNLLEYDRLRAGQLVETLEQYLLNDCQPLHTASALHIHVGTLHYRLGRIESITGKDIRTLDARIELQLAIRALRALHPYR